MRETIKMNRRFARKPLAIAVSAAIAGTALAVSMPSMAAEADDQVTEEIVVRGIRGSLSKSADLKRDSAGVLDAITAEDIGDFPDTNLAESLQRITGVAIDRERGEGKNVTVRGFGPQFNLVTLNGRQLPTNQGLSRSFDFGNLASEGVAAVEVYKSARADVPTGGIGSTINIVTTRPLEAPGLKATVAASAMRDHSRYEGTKTTPEVSALFSNTFADDTVGVSLSLVRQERESGGNTANVGAWHTFDGAVNNSWGCGDPANEAWGGIPAAPSDCNSWQATQTNRPEAGELYSVPQSIGYEIASYDRTRTNGQLMVQFQPSDAVRATVDYTFAELELARSYTNLSSWFNFDAQETTYTDGPIATPLIYKERLGNSDLSMASGYDAFVSKLDSVGLNVEWEVNDRLSLELDHHSSTSERKPDSPYGDSALLSLAIWDRDETTGYFGPGQELPILEVVMGEPISAANVQTTGSVFARNVSDMEIDQTRLSGTFNFDSSVIESVDFGIELSNVSNEAAFSAVQRDAWGSALGTPIGAIEDLLTPASMAGAFDQIPGGNDPRLQTEYFRFDMQAMITRMESLMASGDMVTFAGTMNNGDCGTGLCTSSDWLAQRFTEEESQAAYFQANLVGSLGGLPTATRLGLRYEKTDVESRALSPNYVGLDWVGGNELVANTAGTAFSQKSGDYNVFLPSLDFRVDVTDDVVARFSASKSMTRPDYLSIDGGRLINNPVRVTGGSGSGGNPGLLPYESVNIDLSLEYYYGEGSYVAAGYFRKKVENFIENQNVVEVIDSLPHPALGPLVDDARAAGISNSGEWLGWILGNRADADGVNVDAGRVSGVVGRDPGAPIDFSTPVNREETATMDGWELVLQHNFGSTGFGLIANVTLVDADISYDNTLDQFVDQFVLTGLGDTANLVAFYDKDGFSARIAYNWRDDFLGGIGQSQQFGGARNPSFTAAYQQVDLGVNYWINDNFQVYLDALNVTDETTHVYGRVDEQTLFAAQLGPRYNLGVRYKF
jgi:TonB-dependent receptor